MTHSNSDPDCDVPAVPRPREPMLRFLGGVGTVTGSRFLIDTPEARVLVECGLFQGLKDLRRRNWAAFPVEPASVDAVVVTHAHLDHCGYLPALEREGFRGRVFATAGTRALAEIVLEDSARIQEDDAAYANRMGFSKHRPALPLYTEADAAAVLARFEEVAWGSAVPIAGDVRATFRPAGHILGSAQVEIETDAGARVGLSGDLGRAIHPILRPPAPPPAAQTLLVESTYGGRRHEDDAATERFAAAATRALGRGGVVLVPAFAVDRTELVLLLLRDLMAAGRVPEVPVYVDSPMALAAMAPYRRAIEDGWPEVRPELRGDEAPFAVGRYREVRSRDESVALTHSEGPAIVVSASGMATGGRILHHLASRLPDPRSAVVLVGFQAAGTRGRRLLEGARTIKLLGRYVPVRAEVVDACGLSVHADHDELIDWLAAAPDPPEVVFVVHGEPEASAAVRDAVESKLGWPAVVPRPMETVRLSTAR